MECEQIPTVDLIVFASKLPNVCKLKKISENNQKVITMATNLLLLKCLLDVGNHGSLQLAFYFNIYKQ